MAPDEVHFLILLYLIYVSDCFVVPQSTALLLYSSFGGMRFRVKSTDAAPVFFRRFWMLRPLFPPLGFSRSLELSRCAFSTEGFCSVSPIGLPVQAGEEVQYIAYGDVDSIEVQDQALMVNGRRWFKGRGLEELKANLEAIMTATDRKEALREQLLLNAQRGAEAGAEIRETEKRTGLLNIFCSLYAVVLLVYLPVVLFRFSPAYLIWALGVPLLLIHLICAMLFLRTHRRLVPDDRWHRWESFWKMVLCPPMMIRACDAVGDRCAIHGDAIATLMAVCDEDKWMPVVRSVWRLLLPGQVSKLPDQVSGAVAEYGEVYREVLASELQKKGVEVAALEVDISAIPEGQRFCPRCESFYREEIEVCHDCGGVPLLAREES